MPHEDPDHWQYAERAVEFTELSFSNHLRLQTENAFKQFHLRVFVDARERNAAIPFFRPKTTPASNGEEMHSLSTRSGRTHGATGSVTLALNPQGTLTGTSTTTNENTVSTGKNLYTSPISGRNKLGKIWWDYQIDDDRYKRLGYPMPEDVLPTVRFKFYGDHDKPQSPPPQLDIAITSYWSRVSQSELPEKGAGMIHNLNFLHLFRSSGKTKTKSESYSNLFQIVAFTADVPNLSMDTYYPALVKINLDSGISGLHENLRPEAKSHKAIENMTAVVAEASGMYITLLTCGLGSDETNIFRSGEARVGLDKLPDDCKCTV